MKFDEVRRYTKEAIDEFKRLIERQGDKIERIERERIKAEAELLAKINGLEARLAALSEKALHAAVADVVAEFARRSEKQIPGRTSENEESPSGSIAGARAPATVKAGSP